MKIPSKADIIAIVPARGNSKGIPEKNIRLLAGHPLIAHTILDANESQLINRIYVSTDDPKIIEISREYGAEIIPRPSELAEDTASSESVLIHALTEIEKSGIITELVVFLQCTSPLRDGADIDRAITQFHDENADSMLSVSPNHRFIWESLEGAPRSINYDYQKRPRRQEMRRQFMENGSIYIFKPWVLKKFGNRLGGKIALFEMTEEQSWEIDTIADFKYVETLINRKSQIE